MKTIPKSLSINDTWCFCLGEVPGAEDPACDDSTWDEITVPHPRPEERKDRHKLSKREWPFVRSCPGRIAGPSTLEMRGGRARFAVRSSTGTGNILVRGMVADLPAVEVQLQAIKNSNLNTRRTMK